MANMYKSILERAIVTIYSAASDTVKIYNLDTSNWENLCTTDSTGASSEKIHLKPGTYQLKSSIAKDPDNLSNDFTKTITVHLSDTSVYLMPDGSVGYWYGYIDNTLIENITSENGWRRSESGTDYTKILPTYNTNNLIVESGFQEESGIGSKNSVFSNNVYAIVEGITSRSGTYIQMTCADSKITNSSSETSSTSDIFKLVLQTNKTGYPAVGTVNQRKSNVYAFWWD